MHYKRREFLKLSGSFASTALVAGMAGKDMLSSFFDNDPKKLKAFGLQLWTLRADLPKDPQSVLKQVAVFGYKQIESFEGAKGMFWGMSNTEFKKYLDDLGMTIISSHCNINKDFEKKADEAAAIGMKYLMCPYLGAQKTIDAYKEKADLFNKCGEIAKKAGIRFGYHNHDYSFKPIDGVMPQDVMMQATDPGLVDYEMDIFWVVAAGQDPEEWIKKYPNRFTAGHVKDKTKNTDKISSCIVGEGSIDFKKILKTGKKNGMKYFIVEQEEYATASPIESAKADAEYMKKLSI